MEEEKKEEVKKEAENVKKETVDTAKKFKETMKETNIKEETKVTGNFIKSMFKSPIETIKDVTTDKTGKYFKTALILLIIWTILVFISSTYTTIYLWGFARVFVNITSVLKAILAPAIGILVSSIIVLVLNKNNKKSLTDIISTVTVTKLPMIFAKLVSLLVLFSNNITTITIPFTALCETIAIVLGFFGFKFLFKTESSKEFIKKYVLIQVIYYICYIVIGLFGIYI